MDLRQFQGTTCKDSFLRNREAPGVENRVVARRLTCEYGLVLEGIPMVRSQKQNSTISHIAKRVDLLACLMVTALAVALPAVLSLNAFENNWRNSNKQELTAGMQVLLWNADKQRVKSLLGTPAQIAPPKNMFVEQVSCW